MAVARAMATLLTSTLSRKRMKGDLVSAMLGGQWTQARKAAVPSVCISDTSCQLCHGASGTLEHRFVCPALVPDGGWPVPTQRACKALHAIDARRRAILQQRALLVIRLPARPSSDEGSFRWIRQSFTNPKIDENTLSPSHPGSKLQKEQN